MTFSSRSCNIELSWIFFWWVALPIAVSLHKLFFKLLFSHFNPAKVISQFFTSSLNSKLAQLIRPNSFCNLFSSHIFFWISLFKFWIWQFLTSKSLQREILSLLPKVKFCSCSWTMDFKVSLSSFNWESFILFWHLISVKLLTIFCKLLLSPSLIWTLFTKLFNLAFNSHIWASFSSISFPKQLFSPYKFLLHDNFSLYFICKVWFSLVKQLILLLYFSSFIFFSHSKFSLHWFKAATSCSKLQYLSFNILKSFSRNSNSNIWAFNWLINMSFSLLMQFSPYSLRLQGDLGLEHLFGQGYPQ